MLEETMEALDTLVRTGKVRNLRTSELSLSPEETARLDEVSPQPLLYRIGIRRTPARAVSGPPISA